MTCITEVALIFVDNPDPEGQGFCQAGFSVDFTKVTNLPPQPCLCISSIWLHTPVQHILLFVQNLTAVVSSFKWKWFYVSLCPFIQAGWGLIPYYFFFSTYSVACKSFSIILLKMHKQTHRNKHKPIFEACVLISTFSPISSLVFFSISQEGTLVVGGPGSFYWQGNTLLLIILSFPSFHPFTEFLWVRLADTSLSYPRLTVS